MVYKQQYFILWPQGIHEDSYFADIYSKKTKITFQTFKLDKLVKYDNELLYVLSKLNSKICILVYHIITACMFFQHGKGLYLLQDYKGQTIFLFLLNCFGQHHVLKAAQHKEKISSGWRGFSKNVCLPISKLETIFSFGNIDFCDSYQENNIYGL